MYHAAGVAQDLRKQSLGGGDPEKAYNGITWLYDGIEMT